MARTPRTTTPEAAEVILNGDALTSASTALATLSTEAQQVQAMLGLPSLDPDVLCIQITGLVQQTGRALFEIGCRLYGLRAVLPKQDWEARLEDLGFTQRSAAKLMRGALKCVDANGDARQRLLALPQAKVLELVALDDEKLDELEKTGAIGQLALEFDEIDRMSASELRRKVRELEASNAAKDRVLQKKGAEIDKLHEAAEHQPTPDEEAEAAAAVVASLRDATTAAETAITQLLAASRDAVDNAGAQEHVATAARTGVEYLAQLFADGLQRHGFEVQFDDMVTPAWLADAKGKKGRKG